MNFSDLRDNMYSRIYVEISNICNKSCSFCHGTSRTGRRMSFDEFKLTLSKIRHLTNYLYFNRKRSSCKV
ncbi:MAG: hypothetical protein IJW38_01870, partial [Clostridia bacterium]|nr:hypothetical protein [Clostridia bacterium]